MTPARARQLADECAKGCYGHANAPTLIAATILDAVAEERRDTANAAGAILRDAARDLERSAAEHDREGDAEEAELNHLLAREMEKISAKLYALGDQPAPQSTPTVDDDDPF